MMSQPTDPSPNEAQAPLGESFLSFAQLVRALTQYLQGTVELIAGAFGAEEDRDSEVRLRLLFETLASTRLRAKLSLEGLDRVAEDEHGALRFQVEGITPAIFEFEKQPDTQLSKDDIWDRIVAFDDRIQSALEQLHQTEPDMEESLGQVLSIFSMMRRACSYVVSSESQTA